MNVVSIQFKISEKHNLYTVAYSEFLRQWSVYNGTEFIDSLPENRPRIDRSDKRAKQILRLALNGNRT